MSARARPTHDMPAGGDRRSPAGSLSPHHPRLRVAARLAYVVIVLFATLPGTGWDADPVLMRLRLLRALRPGLDAADVVDGVRNVVLFAGLGMVWIATTRTRRLWPPLWRVTAAGALLSLLVETIQLTSPVRYSSVVDVATNTLGAFLGALATAVVVRFTRWELEKGTSEMPTLLIAASYLVASALEAFSPWGRPDRVPGAWGGPGRRFAAALAWLRSAPLAAPTASDVLLFLPAGALAAAALIAYGWRPARAAVAASVVCALLYTGAELARGVAGGDMRPLAMLTHGAAAAVGAVACAAVYVMATRRRGAQRTPRPAPSATPVVAGTLLVLLCWYWRPFALRGVLIPTLPHEALVPLAALRQLFNLYSVADVAVDFLLYFPLGVWLTVRPLRRGGPLGGVLPALWAAAIIETGQLWVRDRTFDVTDPLVQWAGVLVGVAVVAQARLRVLRGPQAAPGKPMLFSRRDAGQRALG